MTIDWWTLGLQTVNVLVLLWILSHFLFRPVSEIIAKRQAAAMQELDAAKAARAEAEEARGKVKAQMDEVAAARADLVSKAKDAADREKRQVMDAAHQEVEALRAAAREDLAHLREGTEKEMRHDAAELAVDIARRLLDRLPPSARVSGFIDGLADAVARLPERTRTAIGGEGPVPIRAAAEMTGDEVDHLSERLARAVGHPIELAVSVDPSLVAGLELDAPHAIVRNNFRADLDRVRQEVLKDD